MFDFRFLFGGNNQNEAHTVMTCAALMLKVHSSPRPLFTFTSTCYSTRNLRYQTGRRHASSAPSDPEKPYYVTTPIFYINAAPHVGHLYALVLADVLKRWQVLLGKRAILCTGTDEHGMKIQRAAAKARMDVRAFCDQTCKHFEKLAQRANIAQDHFIRTSEPDHRFAVQHFWLMLKQRGYIYDSKHEGWYAVSDETFYPSSVVRLTLDPSTGRKFMASIETGKEVEWTSETNYHFRLSAFRDRLLEFYEKNPKFIVPETRMTEVINAVTSGLEDLSVSRPAERLSWGIPVPDDHTQTIYVWLDALCNYLTKANYPFQVPGQEDTAGWPADCHVIGKDIVRFHCIYWPAFLMALDLPLPRQVLTHAHWTLGQQKMAKSTGNVVNPFFAIDRFDVDTMRFYLVHDGGIQDDADYENSHIVERYKKALQGQLGNLASRIVRGKRWNVRSTVVHATTRDASPEGELGKEHYLRLIELPGTVSSKMTELNSSGAVREIMKVIYKTNVYLQKTQPWDLTEDPDKLAELTEILYVCAESLRICGILLQPIMPDKMKRMLDMLGVAPDARMYANAVYGSDHNYGECSTVIRRDKGFEGVLFPPLISET
ncbi:MAG: methionyl-tRNA synthetase [Icmadophila ericetorum]|nr:methionyl-tRNA synthetase [Icmadophila ericetorum]